MIEYDIAIKWRLDLKNADLLMDLAILYRWNKLTVADEYPEILDRYNRVICDVSIPNGENDNKTDDE